MSGIQAISCCTPIKKANVLGNNNNVQMVNNKVGLANDVFEKQNDVSFGGGKWVPQISDKARRKLGLPYIPSTVHHKDSLQVHKKVKVNQIKPKSAFTRIGGKK